MYEIPFEKFEILNLIGAEEIEIFGRLWLRGLHDVVPVSEVDAHLKMKNAKGKPLFEIVVEGGRID